jgi:L-ribulokinase
MIKIITKIIIVIIIFKYYSITYCLFVNEKNKKTVFILGVFYTPDCGIFGMLLEDFMDKEKYVLGIDFGSDSVRAIVINAGNGTVICEGVGIYKRWAAGLYSIPSEKQYRQHPSDYLEAFESAVHDAMKNTDESVWTHIIALGFDATSSTVTPLNRDGIPLALTGAFSENPDAMFYLWKDHTAYREASEITVAFSSSPVTDYCRYQGTYQSEWFWAKILHCARKNTEVIHAAYSWIELCDWMPSLLTGITNPHFMYRCCCAAGHKAFFNSNFGGLPDRNCLEQLDPYLADVAGTYALPEYSCRKVGTITKEWARRLCLNESVTIGGSSCDAHAGAVGAGIQRGTLVKIIGTSAVDILIEKPEVINKGNISAATCGMAENSVIPGYYGMETGQAAFGDIYSWFKRLIVLPVTEVFACIPELSAQMKDLILTKLDMSLLKTLEDRLEELPPLQNVISLDWFNGRRYPVLNETAKGAVAGLDLGVDALRLYQSLIFSTLFGARKIFEQYLVEGIVINKVIVVGGIARKSPYILQTLSNVLHRTICVSAEKQVCARGAAVFAAVAAGIYADIPSAQNRLCNQPLTYFYPQMNIVTAYDEQYQKYVRMGNLLENF